MGFVSNTLDSTMGQTQNTQPGTSTPGAGGKGPSGAPGGMDQYPINSENPQPGYGTPGGGGKAPMDTGAGDNPTQMPPPGFGAPGTGGKFTPMGIGDGSAMVGQIDNNGNIIPGTGGAGNPNGPGTSMPGVAGKGPDALTMMNPLPIVNAIGNQYGMTPEQLAQEAVNGVDQAVNAVSAGPMSNGAIRSGPLRAGGPTLGLPGGTPADQFGMARNRLQPVPAPSRVPGRPTPQAIRQQAQAVGLPGATRPAPVRAPARPTVGPAPVARGPVRRGAGRGGLLR